MGVKLELLGMKALEHPGRYLLGVLLVLGVCAAGILNFKVDDSLTELFRSDSKEFRNYVELSSRFPSSEYDVLVVVEGNELLTPNGLRALQQLSLDLEFVDGIKGQLSLLSARELPGPDGFPPPLIPAKIPQPGPAFEDLKKRIHANQIAGGGKLISRDGTLTLLVLSLDQTYVRKKGLEHTISQINEAAREALKGTPLRMSLSGAPVMQLEIRNAVKKDRFIYNLSGFILGVLICWFFFRKIPYVLIAVLPPALAIIWSLGVLGFIGVKLNLFLNVIIPLVMVIAFADSMHMVFTIRDKMEKGFGRFNAIAYGVRRIGPACVLTSLTTGLAMLSLLLSSSSMVRTFGMAAAMSTVLAFLAVIIAVPVLSWFLLMGQEKRLQQKTAEPFEAREEQERDSGWLHAEDFQQGRQIPARIATQDIQRVAASGDFESVSTTTSSPSEKVLSGAVHSASVKKASGKDVPPGSVGQADEEPVQGISGKSEDGLHILARLSARWAEGMPGWQTSALISSLVLAVVSFYIFINLNPRYRLADQIPDKEQAVFAQNRLDTKLTGANPVHVMIEWSDKKQLYTPETLAVIAQVHSIVEKQAGLGNVWSVEMLRRWLLDTGEATPANLKKYVGLLPKHLTTRFVEPSERAVVVTGRVPDLDASQILPVIERLDAQLEELRKKHPEYSFKVTGLTAIAARNSARMIDGMGRNLIMTILVVGLLIGFVFRSWRGGLASLIPNLLPISLTGVALYLTGHGMQFASVIALTVAFGLAVDNSIHFLHRLRNPAGEVMITPLHIRRAIAELGPVLVLTTLVLTAGMGLTVLSGLPSLRLFGGLIALSLVLALISALYALPAMLMVLRDRKNSRAGER